MNENVEFYAWIFDNCTWLFSQRSWCLLKSLPSWLFFITNLDFLMVQPMYFRDSTTKLSGKKVCNYPSRNIARKFNLAQLWSNFTVLNKNTIAKIKALSSNNVTNVKNSYRLKEINWSIENQNKQFMFVWIFQDLFLLFELCDRKQKFSANNVDMFCMSKLPTMPKRNTT